MNDWQQFNLGEIAGLTIGRTPPRKNPDYWTQDTTHPFCTISDMPIHSWHINPKREGITDSAIMDGKVKLAPAGSLLMSFKLTIGRVGLAERNVYPNEAIVRIDPHDSSEVDKRYLAVWLESRDLTTYAPRAVKGKTLNSKSLAAIPVSLPPLSTQLRIIEVVQSIDDQLQSLDAETKALVALLRARKENLFSSYALTGTSSRIGQILKEIKRPVTVDSDSSYRQIGIKSHGRGIFTKEAVSGKALGTKKVFWVEPGDLVINIVFAWEGAVAVVPRQITGHCGSHRFPTYRRDDGGDVEFFRYFFSTKAGTQLLSDCSPGGAGRNRTLNRTRLLNARLSVPPLAEQKRAVCEFQELETQIETLRAETVSLRDTRKALVSALLDRTIEIEPQS